MMTCLKLTSTALLLVVTGSMAMAAFSDTDGDGKMSQDEFVAAYPDGTEDLFTAIDADADGIISEEEHAAAVDAGLLTD